MRYQDVNQKEVNKQWAIDMIAKVPPILVTKRVISCDGGGNPALGHPRVYINLDSYEPVACIYCGLRYQYVDKLPESYTPSAEACAK